MSSLRRLRAVAFLEGLSYLFLLFVAMPLKYVWEMPLAVRITGSLHGILFIVFLAALGVVVSEHGWNRNRTLLALLASVVPFGTFPLDGALRREMTKLGMPN